MKKGFVLTLIVALLLALFVSCNNANEKEVATTTTAVAETVSPPKEAEPVKALSTLEQIRKRGYLVAGVNSSNPGFSFLQEDGQYKGFEVELAKAISVAVFGTPDKIEYRPLTSKERFTALQSGEIDVLIRTATINTTRDTELDLISLAHISMTGRHSW